MSNKIMSEYQTRKGYLPYHVFDENLCYKAITLFVNDEIDKQKLTLNTYTEEDIKKHLTIDLNDHNSWILSFIDDARFQIHQAEETVSPTDPEKIAKIMSECLADSEAGQIILEKFLENKYLYNKKFVLKY